MATIAELLATSLDALKKVQQNGTFYSFYEVNQIAVTSIQL